MPAASSKRKVPPPADTPATRATRDAIERTLGTLFSGSNEDCTLRQLLAKLRHAGFGYARVDVEPILHAMDCEPNGRIMYRDGRVHLI